MNAKTVVVTALLLAAAGTPALAQTQGGRTLASDSVTSFRSMSNDRLIPHVTRTSSGTIITFEQPVNLQGKQPQALSAGVTGVDFQIDRRNLSNYPYLIPDGAIGEDAGWKRTTQGFWPGAGWQYAGPLMPFYGTGIGISFGDGQVRPWTW